MKEYVWLFPIIFMFHDMEEIIGFKFFLRQNETELKKRFPFILRRYKDFSTEGFALAVYEELILCILISTLAFFLDRNFLWYIWLGAFLGIYRRYIPACITSLICLPINTLIICKCLLCIEDSVLFAGLFMALGAILVFVNIFIAQKLMGWFTRKTN